MDDRDRRHALTLNEAHEYFGGYEGLTGAERRERARFVRLRDGERRPAGGAMENMARYQLDRRER